MLCSSALAIAQRLSPHSVYTDSTIATFRFRRHAALAVLSYLRAYLRITSFALLCGGKKHCPASCPLHEPIASG